MSSPGPERGRWAIMDEKREFFEQALEGKKIPVLSLDHKWHRLFTQTGKSTAEINSLQEELNELLKKQGKANTQIKNLGLYKKKLMDEIVALSDGINSGENADELAEHKRLLEECNQKIDEYRDQNMDLPRDIDAVNKKLMLSTMELCYDMIQENTEEIKEISDWVDEIRVEIKRKVVKKQEKIIWNQELYSYMHDIFGPEVIEIFDMEYFSEYYIKDKEKDKENSNAVHENGTSHDGHPEQAGNSTHK